jgi:methyl-galactoside transport system substrate-binding protein
MMKVKRGIIFLIIIIISSALIDNIKNNIYARVNVNINTRNVTNVGVSIYNFNDPYLSQVKQSLEDIQNKNENTVKFTFLDGKNDQSIQNENIDYFLNNDYDLLLLNLHDTNGHVIENVVNKVKQINKPLILFNIEPLTIQPVLKSYNKAIILSKDFTQSGILQGKTLINEWNNNRRDIDKNNDYVMQYIMLVGENNNTAALQRTKYSILAINNAGIKTQELASKVCNWDQDCGKNSIENLFMAFGNKIEAIIANNDDMAIGAVEALQKYGYNTGDKSKYIPVVGVDGISKAKELVNKGAMSGTVIQDPNELANALYTVGMSLVYNRDPLDGTNYVFNATGNTIEMPYYEYIK